MDVKPKETSIIHPVCCTWAKKVGPIVYTRNLPYFSLSECGKDMVPQGGVANTLDLYAPQHGKDLPVIVYIKGGAWTDRHKEDFANFGAGLAAHCKAIVAVPNYRLSPRKLPSGVEHPEHMLDVACAIMYTCAVASRYGGDWRNLALVGHSAGGHMAGWLTLKQGEFLEKAMTRVDSSVREALKGCCLNISAAVGISGIYNLVTFDEDFPSYRQAFLEYAFGPFEKEKYKACSPQFAFDKDDPRYTSPVDYSAEHKHWLILHSPKDTLVNIRQSKEFQEMLVRLGWDATLDTESLQGTHFGDILSVNITDESGDPRESCQGILQEIRIFLHKSMKNPTS